MIMKFKILESEKFKKFAKLSIFDPGGKE